MGDDAKEFSVTSQAADTTRGIVGFAEIYNTHMVEHDYEAAFWAIEKLQATLQITTPTRNGHLIK